MFLVSGTCALTEAEHHCDGEICRILLQKANANPDALEQVKLPRDVRIWKNPRSPTPEMLLASPRRKNIKRNTELLSPLVASNNNRQKSNLSNPSLCSFQEETDNDDLESSLSDVQEEEETNNERQRYRKRTRSRKGTSLPDLRGRGMFLVGENVSELRNRGKHVGIPLSHSMPSFSDESTLRPSAERRLSKHTLEDLPLNLPQLSEEEEDEYDEEIEHPQPHYQQLLHQKSLEDKRNSSISLPDLSHRAKRVTVTKKANGAYVTRLNGINGAANDDVANGTDPSKSRIQLPHLNLSAIKTTNTRTGFQGNHAVSRGQTTSGKKLKLAPNRGNSSSPK